MATPSKKSASKKVAKAVAGKGRSAKAGLIFPVGRIGSLLRKGRYAKRVSASSAVYLAAVLEYLTAELLELSAKAAQGKKSKSNRLSPRAITLAVRHDEDIGALLQNVTIARGGVIPNVHKALEKKKKGSKKSAASPKKN
jgi:histone H2A